MAENRENFTFIWKIKNFSFCFSEKEIYSPSFFAHLIGGTTWRLLLCPNSFRFNDCVTCYVYRLSGPDKLALDLELSFLAGDESVLQSETILKKVCKKSDNFSIAKLYVERYEVFLLKKDLFIPDDTLTIRFRMWDSQESTSPLEKCFAETRIGAECRSVVGTIEKFSYVEPRKMYTLCNKSSSAEISLFSTKFTVSADGLLDIQITSLKPINYHRCEIFILDKFKNKVKTGQGEFYNTQPHCILLAVSKAYLIKNNEWFLPNDALTIRCDVIFPAGEANHEMKYIFDYQGTQEVISNTRSTDVSSQEHPIENLKTLKNDLISLFREGILCDTKLKTATETFPAHMAILSARSPVFKAMFTTDMKEKTNNCVDVDDLDADTVRRMLLFMYSATLDDLEYESAKNLYFAADKYNIVPLRHRCSSFLKQNLLHSNCCDILLLADKHHDKDLKDAVQDYIAKNDEAVLFSDEWRNLEKNHSQLIVEVFRFIYMKNRRN
ncbi:TD and POZ domain-containing protein 3 [Araneus ventricosus]|uniref:TD and POZ domain-containing protein 3 n=1 Tax=Araneus ventricosus TaxID=182803 RepID=A0A4Y2D7F3_ARAVE|nr:TD and POZ domain-containing protein 3 [Araneus ventricosus]